MQVRTKGRNQVGELEGRGEESKPTNKLIQGAQSPLLGDEGGSQSHPSDDTGAQQSSLAPVGVPEVCGRGSRKQEDEKRTKLVLEKWAQVHSKKEEGATRKPRPKKRNKTEDNPAGKGYKDMRRMFEEMRTAQDKE